MTNNGLSYLDVLIVIILAIFVFRGFKRGFAGELTKIIGVILALMLSTKFMNNVAEFLVTAANIPPAFAMVVSFVMIFVATILLFKYAGTHLEKLIKVSVALKTADNFLGAILGLFKGAIFVSLFMLLLTLLSFSDAVQYHTKHSLLFGPMRDIAPAAYDALKKMAGSESFIMEFEEAFSGIARDKRGQGVNLLIDHFQAGK
ncbi:CvpA family protein [candidate division KSB1 bacterium]|nr:CvpA family protein [candidate division KSB1 bacterium]